MRARSSLLMGRFAVQVDHGDDREVVGVKIAFHWWIRWTERELTLI